MNTDDQKTTTALDRLTELIDLHGAKGVELDRAGQVELAILLLRRVETVRSLLDARLLAALDELQPTSGEVFH